MRGADKPLPKRRIVRTVVMLGTLGLVGAGQGFARDLTVIEAQHGLSGKWAGDGTTLIIDGERLQANVDPDRPFDWRTFRLVNVSGRMVVFDIGAQRFLAMMDLANTLRVTSPGFAGERALHLIRR